MKKPYNLYRYDCNKTIVKHRLERDCAPQIVFYRDSINSVLWRCRHGTGEYNHDHYGYASREEAMREELEKQQTNLLDLHDHIAELKRKLE